MRAVTLRFLRNHEISTLPFPRLPKIQVYKYSTLLCTAFATARSGGLSESCNCNSRLDKSGRNKGMYESNTSIQYLHKCPMDVHVVFASALIVFHADLYIFRYVRWCVSYPKQPDVPNFHMTHRRSKHERGLHVL